MFERAFTQQRLLDAWEEARDAAYADGEARVEVERFEAAAARNVSEIAEALADGSTSRNPFSGWRSPSPVAVCAGSPFPFWKTALSSGRCWPSLTTSFLAAGVVPGRLGLQAKALARAVLDPARGYRPVRWKS